MGKLKREKIISRCCDGKIEVITQCKSEGFSFNKPDIKGDDLFFLCKKCSKQCDVKNATKRSYEDNNMFVT